MKTVRWIALLALVLLVPSHDLSAWTGGPWNTTGGNASLPFLGLYGDGSDGNATFDGVTAVAGASLAGGTYTLARDVTYVNATVGTSATSVAVLAFGWRMFVQNNLTIANSAGAGSVITNNGSSAVACTIQTGQSGGIANVLGNQSFPATGGNGGNNAAGSAATALNHALGGAGAAGGSATNAGGAGGGVTTFAGDGTPHNVLSAITGSYMVGGSGSFQNSVQGGAGGGGGGSAVAGAIGGGGGGGGGILGVYAYNITNNATGGFTSKGGHGCNASGVGAAGGGGGGGGGVVYLVYHLCGGSTGCTVAGGGVSVAAGIGGTGQSGGNAGSNGSVGTFIGLQN